MGWKQHNRLKLSQGSTSRPQHTATVFCCVASGSPSLPRRPPVPGPRVLHYCCREWCIAANMPGAVRQPGNESMGEWVGNVLLRFSRRRSRSRGSSLTTTALARRRRFFLNTAHRPLKSTVLWSNNNRTDLHTASHDTPTSPHPASPRLHNPINTRRFGEYL